MSKRIIGRQEVVALPSFGIDSVQLKVDTGAYTSSLHCKKSEVLLIDGKEKLRIHLDPKKFSDLDNHIIELDEFKIARVRSSNGVLQQRYKIKIPMRLGGKMYRLSFTLADRSKMQFPILLGRKFLTNRFLVDVSLANNLSE